MREWSCDYGSPLSHSFITACAKQRGVICWHWTLYWRKRLRSMCRTLHGLLIRQSLSLGIRNSCCHVTCVYQNMPEIWFARTSSDNSNTYLHAVNALKGQAALADSAGRPENDEGYIRAPSCAPTFKSYTFCLRKSDQAHSDSIACQQEQLRWALPQESELFPFRYRFT